MGSAKELSSSEKKSHLVGAGVTPLRSPQEGGEASLVGRFHADLSRSQQYVIRYFAALLRYQEETQAVCYIHYITSSKKQEGGFRLDFLSDNECVRLHHLLYNESENCFFPAIVILPLLLLVFLVGVP